MKRCEYCIYARLIYNKEERDKFVGCIKHSGEEKYLLKSLENFNYFFGDDNYIRYGWVYPKLLPTSNPEDYDHIDSGIIANLCLITPKNSYCDLFKMRGNYYE